MNKTIPGLIAICTMLFNGSVAASGGPIKTYLSDFVTPTIVDITPTSGAASVPPEFAACPNAPPNAVFGVNFTAGMDYKDDTLYGIEWENGSGPNIFLYSMASSFCATGTRVGANPIGFTNLESLAYCAVDGFFYSVDFSFPAHTGRLIRIDPATGLGALVGGTMGFDVRIMGMTCDAMGTLHAITSGHASRATELYTVNRNTGVETLVGATGTATLTMEALALDTSGTTPRFFGGKNTLYEIDAATGAATPVSNGFNSIWAMAQIRKTQGIDSDSDGVDDAIDNCTNKANPNQRDTDGDGHGNFCDPDFDNNCLINFLDLQYMQTHFFSNDPDADLDGSGLANFIDLQIMQTTFFGPPGPSSSGICN